MNKIKPIISIVGLILFLNIHLESQANIDFCHNENNSFINGEKLTYDLYYNWNFIWIPAGTLTFLIEEKEEEYFIEAIGKTHDSYGWFYKVDDYYSCSIDKETLLPRHFMRDIKEGNYHILNKIKFDKLNNKLTSSVCINKGETREYTFDKENCVLDILSLVYNLRNIDIDLLKEREVINVDLIFDEKIYHIPIRYQGEERNKKIRNLGKFDILKISPDVISGHIFNSDSDLVIWVSDDINKVPLMIESPIKVGSVKAILKSYENLKNPWPVDGEN